jgi:hypothetical protein
MSESGMRKAPGRWRKVSRPLQLALVLLIFCLTVGHGIVIGNYDVGFHPMYRLRQTLAVAISRMQVPPAHGYLAHQSVIDALDQNGFAIFPNDKGSHLDVAGWTELFADPARLDAALKQATTTPIDPSLPPQLIRGNELGYADYVYAAFRLFGPHFASLYYFYFVLLGAGCILFILEFRASPFLMFLLSAYLAGLFFLQNYAISQGDQLVTLANSRLFDALSLLPAMHVFLTIWLRLPLRKLTVATVAGQSALLAFLIDCRTTSLWLIAMIVAGSAVMVIEGRNGWLSERRWREVYLAAGWPAAIAVALLALQMAFIGVDADKRYRSETEYHLIWHEVLRGMLASNLELQRIYVGKVTELDDQTDQIAYDAVMKDINARDDDTSSIAYRKNGYIHIDLDRSYLAYDHLARSLALRMMIAHPLLVGESILEKFAEQINWFTLHGAMRGANLASAAGFTAVAGLLWLMRGGVRTPDRRLLRGTAAATIVLACALAPPLIAPSNLSVGTLLAFLIAASAGLFALIILAVRLAEKLLGWAPNPNQPSASGTSLA